MIGIGIGVPFNRRGGASSPYHPSQEAGYLSWFDGETLARDNTAGNVIASWQSHEGTYLATQATNSMKPVAQADTNGVMFARSDGVDDFMTINIPALNNGGVWVVTGGRFINGGPNAAVLAIGDSSIPNTTMGLTIEVNTRHLAGVVISNRTWVKGTYDYAAAYTPPAPNTRYADVQILDKNGVDRATSVSNNNDSLNYNVAGARLFNIKGLSATFCGMELYFAGIFSGVLDVAAYQRAMAFGLEKLPVAV